MSATKDPRLADTAYDIYTVPLQAELDPAGFRTVISSIIEKFPAKGFKPDGVVGSFYAPTGGDVHVSVTDIPPTSLDEDIIVLAEPGADLGLTGQFRDQLADQIARMRGGVITAPSGTGKSTLIRLMRDFGYYGFIDGDNLVTASEASDPDFYRIRRERVIEHVRTSGEIVFVASGEYYDLAAMKAAGVPMIAWLPPLSRYAKHALQGIEAQKDWAPNYLGQRAEYDRVGIPIRENWLSAYGALTRLLGNSPQPNSWFKGYHTLPARARCRLQVVSTENPAATLRPFKAQAKDAYVVLALKEKSATPDAVSLRSHVRGTFGWQPRSPAHDVAAAVALAGRDFAELLAQVAANRDGTRTVTSDIAVGYGAVPLFNIAVAPSLGANRQLPFTVAGDQFTDGRTPHSGISYYPTPDKARASGSDVVPEIDFDTFLAGGDDRDVYPLKALPGAVTKANVFFKDVWHDVEIYAPHVADAWRKAVGFTAGMANDGASGWLLWLVSLSREDLELGIEVMCRWHQRDCLKEVSDRIKSLGAFQSRTSASFVEVRNLNGRGVPFTNMADDIRTRIDSAAFEDEKAARFDHVRLRAAVRAVIDSELKVTPEWDDPEDTWTRRWGFTKSGAHAKRIEDIKYGHRFTPGSRPNRRQFAEAAEQNAIMLGEPSAHAGAAPKFEHDKTRPIYGCDTVNYFTFHHALTPIERLWQNNSCLLSPGEEDELVAYREKIHAGSFYLCVDYEDFNSQHTLGAMKIVFEELLRDAPLDLRTWCVDSFDNMYIHWRDEFGARMDRMVGTLPSGHRATSAINSILNTAYVAMCAPDSARCRTWHTGDDVFIAAPDLATADIVLKDLLSSPIRLNRSKQILGTLGGEWLRVSFNGHVGRAYTARSIASLVSGNWVADTALSREEYINTYLSFAWTLRNRTDETACGLCLQSSFRRRVPELAHFSATLMTCARSFNNSPVFTAEASVQVCYADFERVKGRVDKQLPSRATQDYIDNHVDHKLLNTADVSPGELKGLMLEASYAKALDRSDAITRVWEGSASVRLGVTLRKAPRRANRGVLSSIFPLTFIKARLTRQQVVALLLAFGHEPKSDVMTQAWGSKSPLATTSDHVPWSVIRSCAGGVRDNAHLKFLYDLRK